MEVIMTTKLTLSVDSSIIAKARRISKHRRTNISAMFSNFIMAKTKLSARRHSRQKIGPLTKSLTGIVKLPEDFDEKEFMSDVFTEKYGLGKLNSFSIPMSLLTSSRPENHLSRIRGRFSTFVKPAKQRAVFPL